MSYLYNSTGYPLYNSSIVRAEGCYVYDTAGKAYLDMEAGVWCLALGHNPPRLTAALQEQAASLGHVGYKYNHPVSEAAAQKLVELAGFPQGKCVFLSSGSEAVEYGIQLAKALHPGKRCMALAGQYLSAYGAGAGIQAFKEYCVPWQGQAQRSVAEWREWLQSTVDLDQVGVFVFEAGNSSGLVELPPHNLVSALGSLLRQQGIPLVVDEVTCGLGRTGKWFGYLHYDLAPDVVALGKGLGNGYPVSAVVFTQAAADAAQGAGFHYAQSHQNDPLGCRIALEVIKSIEEQGLLQQAAVLGEHLRKKYRALQTQFPVIEEIKGIGLLNSIRFAQRVSPKRLERLDQQLFDAGYIVGMKPAQRTLRTYPPLVINRARIDSYIACLKNCLSDV